MLITQQIVLCVRHISPVAYQCNEETSLSRQEGTFVIIRKKHQRYNNEGWVETGKLQAHVSLQ
jgi:hypothetical protein